MCCFLEMAASFTEYIPISRNSVNLCLQKHHEDAGPELDRAISDAKEDQPANVSINSIHG